jgi:hypothetical protein
MAIISADTGTQGNVFSGGPKGRRITAQGLRTRTPWVDDDTIVVPPQRRGGITPPKDLMRPFRPHFQGDARFPGFRFAQPWAVLQPAFQAGQNDW